MTFSDRPEHPLTDAVVLELDMRHSPEKVWRALTEPDLLAEWLLPVVDAELELGATFAYKAQPQPGWDGIVNCRFIEIEAPRKLSYTWVAGDVDTVVTFTLSPSESGTHLSIVQSGFAPDQKREFGGARYGWKMMGERLIDLLSK